MSQLDLLTAPNTAARVYALPDADVSLEPFLADEAALRLFESLRERIEWRQDTVRIFGRAHPIPRLHQWFAEPGMAYSWSGIRMEPRPWIPALSELRERLRARTGLPFNTVLANLYRDGHDTVGWHADDEPEFGPQPTIASVSLGAERDFVLRHKDDPTLRQTIALPNGSLLLMKGRTQQCYKHALPRRARVRQARINLTFRRYVR